MKSLLAFLPIAGFSGVANAHVLEESRSLLDQVSHQLLGVHHLPMVLVIALVVWLALRANRRDSS